MLEIAAFLCLPGALTVLYVLSVIDLREGLLPNEFVMALGALGLVFHISTLFQYLDSLNMVLGAFVGGGILYVIRGGANAIYKDDTLGLGDVKLMAAAGIWLGPEFILIALTAGAFAGFLHGMGVALYTVSRAKIGINLRKMSIPAGPGFAIGIIGAAIVKFWTLPAVLLP